MAVATNNIELQLNPAPPKDRFTTLSSEILLQIINLTQYVPVPSGAWERRRPITRLTSLSLINHRFNNLVQPILWASAASSWSIQRRPVPIYFPNTQKWTGEVKNSGFLSAERAYELLGFVLRNKRLGTYVRDIQIFQALGEWGDSWFCFEGQEFKWLRKEFEGEAQELMKAVCASTFCDDDISAGQAAEQGVAELGSREVKRGKVDESGPEVTWHKEVETRVSAWMSDLKIGKARAYYAFLLLLTPNSQGWEAKKRDAKTPVEDEGFDYVKMVYQAAARQMQEDMRSKQDMAPSEIFFHERRMKAVVKLPRLTTIKEGYHPRSEPAIMTWPPADPKRWTSPRCREKVMGSETSLSAIRQLEEENMCDMAYDWEDLAKQEVRPTPVLGKMRCADVYCLNCWPYWRGKRFIATDLR